MQQVTLKDLSEVELKAIAYDNLAQLEQCQNNIKAINDEIRNRQSIAMVQSPVKGETKQSNKTKTN